ncbi:unnamed protein product, partial [Musa hybrid cultivar]
MLGVERPVRGATTVAYFSGRNWEQTTREDRQRCHCAHHLLRAQVNRVGTESLGYATFTCIVPRAGTTWKFTTKGCCCMYLDAFKSSGQAGRQAFSSIDSPNKNICTILQMKIL